MLNFYKINNDSNAKIKLMFWLWLAVVVIAEVVAWWPWQMNEFLSQYIFVFVISIVIGVECINYCYKRKNFSKNNKQDELFKYGFLIFFCLLVYCFDDQWRDFGATAGYFYSSVFQQAVFFILMPGWLAWRYEKQQTYLISALFYILIHVPNWPLLLVSFIGAVIFARTYFLLSKYRFGWLIIILMSILHCAAGSYLGEENQAWGGMGWDMNIGIRYLSNNH